MDENYMAFNRKNFFDAIKEAVGIKPTNVNGQATARTSYYWWRLLLKAKGLFKIECPDDWDKDYMLENLLLRGKFCVTDTSVGVIPLECQPYGVNLYNRSTDVNIANPILGTMNRTIGRTCEIVYLNDDKVFAGITPLLNVYAEELAQCDAAIDVNLMNSKTAMVFGATSKAEAESLKMMYTKISQGEPAVFMRSTDLSGADTLFFANKAKEIYIADVIHIEKRRIIEEFLTELGVNNANTDKRERLNAEEVNSNNEELELNTAYWVENLNKCCDKVNAMFPEVGLKITMPYRGHRSNARPEQSEENTSEDSEVSENV